MTVRSLDAIRAGLRAHTPRELTGRRRAAVAVALHDGPDGPEALFIERAERFGDPWSGQMAFPGGRVDPGDAGPRAAAERETLEEVGVDLCGAELLGRLGDIDAGVRLVAPLVLSAFVYALPERAPTVPNHEVREALWVPVRRLVDPVYRVHHRWGVSRFPGISVGTRGTQVVWGLTYQLVEELLEVAGRR